MKTSTIATAGTSSPVPESDSDEEVSLLRCWDCNVNFTTKHFLYNHLFHHIKQPVVRLDRVQLPPLKITLKNRSGNSFEIVSSPTEETFSAEKLSPAANLEDNKDDIEKLLGFEGETAVNSSYSEVIQQPKIEELTSEVGDQPIAEEDPLPNGEEDPLEGAHFDEGAIQESTPPESRPESVGGAEEEEYERTDVRFSPVLANVERIQSPALSEKSNASEKETDSTAGVDTITTNHAQEYGNIPGAEPTPPPEPSPEYPKIKIKTTGLFKDPEPPRESLTITEITDDNPNGDPNSNRNGLSHTIHHAPMWTTPSLEDPLKLPDSDDSNLLSLFNNNDRAKDLGFSTSENEFISLDRFDERNRGTMELYNPNSAQRQNPLDSLTGLPMQALAQQVSRLQPSSGNGMHQQNVLINIQQFPSGPPQPSYQPPPMYHYPPHPGQPPMHQPYQYQPPNPMYYPPAPGYPPQHPMQPPPQMGQMGQPPMNQQQMGQPPQMGHQPPMSQAQNQLGPPPQAQQNHNHQMQQAQPYRQPMPPRQPAPRQPGAPGARPPMGGPRQPMAQRQPMGARQRAPMVRPRGPGMTAVRGNVRPRMVGPQNGVRPQQQSPVKRTPEQLQSLQAKKKRMDVLTPSDKDDDDCQVICMQPKNTDGGLPQIESVQGGQSEPSESSIMHLSDSITLSVRNPPPKPVVSPQKSDAKAVANILATRGITVTATAKAKEKAESLQKNSSAVPSALSLNGAVSIVPTAKTNGNSKPANESLPTVDLTDDTSPSNKQPNSPQKPNTRPGLPYRCDLCPAQYPNAMGLNKHRQTYHKTTGGMCELGIPLINLKQPGIMQKLASLGVQNYIPLPSAGADGLYALPVISTRSPGNIGNLGATQMLSLGPVRNIPKPQSPTTNNVQPAARQLPQKT